MILNSPENSPLVSVLMTIYNALPYLKEAIDSIINQTYPDWELIAIENGSSDGSADLLKKYADADSRIKIFSFPENIGRTPALQYALNQAQGEYIAVLDADDIAVNTRFTKQVKYLAENPDISVLGSHAIIIDKTSQIVSFMKYPLKDFDIKMYLCYDSPIAHSSVMYKRNVANKYHGYPDYSLVQDFEFWSTIARGGEKFANLDEFLLLYRVHSQSLTRNKIEEYREQVGNSLYLNIEFFLKVKDAQLKKKFIESLFVTRLLIKTNNMREVFYFSKRYLNILKINKSTFFTIKKVIISQIFYLKHFGYYLLLLLFLFENILYIPFVIYEVLLDKLLVMFIKRKDFYLK